MEGPTRLRIDKWLWHARLCKSRSLAQTLVKTGKVRVNGSKVSVPSRALVAGDVLTVVKERQLYVVRVVALGTRRGPAPEAQALYEDLSPPPVPKPAVDTRLPADAGRRAEGAGRPTKRERRELERFRERQREGE